MRVRRRFLTLLETLIVIAILGLVLGLIGINVGKFVHEQRFRSEVGVVLDTLRTAQSIMLILDNDVHVKFKQKKDSIVINIETACPLSPSWDRILLEPKELHTIHVVTLTNEQKEIEGERGAIDIRFLSGGYAMSQGILRLASAQATEKLKSLESFICLPGYPAPLVSTEQRPEEPLCYALVEEGFVAAMTNLTIAEIKALQEARKPSDQKTNETGGKGKDGQTR